LSGTDNTFFVSSPYLGNGGPMNFIGGDEAINTAPPDRDIFSTAVSTPPPPYPHYRADVWRILSKGPVPPEVMQAYLPEVDRQPDDITGQSFHNHLVPRHFVLWHSPFTGAVWAAAGPILDLRTQTDV